MNFNLIFFPIFFFCLIRLPRNIQSKSQAALNFILIYCGFLMRTCWLGYCVFSSRLCVWIVFTTITIFVALSLYTLYALHNSFSVQFISIGKITDFRFRWSLKSWPTKLFLCCRSADFNVHFKHKMVTFCGVLSR